VLAPENTLAGLEVAARYGCGVEFDVMLSADGTPFVIHDETLERTTSGSGLVAETGDSTLGGLDAGVTHHPRFVGEPLPRFSDLLMRCADLRLAMNVELKPSAGQDELTARVVAEHLSRKGPGRAPIVSSFSETALEVFASASPDLPRGLLVEAIPPDWLARCRHLGACALHAEASSLTRDLVKTVRGAGYWLVVYTENSPDRARDLCDWGVDCIITDRPDLINPSSLLRSA
jgi:glycerophosphoryl diester phosphodiesterase